MADWAKVTDSGIKGEAVYVNLATALSIRREADYTAIALPFSGGPRSHFLHVRETPEQILAASVARS
jgi:hypothetical protein